MWGGSVHGPSMIRPWTRQSTTRRATEVTFRARPPHFYWKIRHHFAFRVSFLNFTPSSDPAEESDSWTTPQILRLPPKPCVQLECNFINYCAGHEKLHLNCTKYCACHDNWMNATSWGISLAAKSASWSAPNIAPATKTERPFFYSTILWLYYSLTLLGFYSTILWLYYSSTLRSFDSTFLLLC